MLHAEQTKATIRTCFVRYTSRGFDDVNTDSMGAFSAKEGMQKRSNAMVERSRIVMEVKLKYSWRKQNSMQALSDCGV